MSRLREFSFRIWRTFFSWMAIRWFDSVLLLCSSLKSDCWWRHCGGPWIYFLEEWISLGCKLLLSRTRSGFLLELSII